MRFATAKRDSNLKLAGISFDVTRDENGYVQSMKMSDDVGNIVLVSKGSSYSETISVQVPATPKMVKRFRLYGMVAGLKADHLFEDKYEAQQALSKYEAATRDGNCELEIEEVEVAEDE